MTNRRSMQGYAQRVSRALQFQPGHVGGRVASAQPVLRRARIGAAGAPVPAAVALYGSPEPIYNATQVTHPVAHLNFGPYYDVPVMLVAAVACVGTPPVLSSGWTEILSGSAGDLYYAAGSLVMPDLGATDVEANFYIGAYPGDLTTMNPPTNQGTMAISTWYCEFAATVPSITGSATGRAAATSHPFESPGSGWVSPFQWNAYLTPDTRGTSSASPTSVVNLSTYPNLGDAGLTGAGYPYLSYDLAPAQLDGEMVGGTITSTRTSASAWDSVSFAFGFTA